MYCNVKRSCPMENRGLIEAIERWIYLNRAPRTTDFENWGQGYSTDFDKIFIQKAEQYRLFDDADSVERFFCQPQAKMHKRLCRDLVKANFLWREINKGFTRKQGLIFFEQESSQYNA